MNNLHIFQSIPRLTARWSAASAVALAALLFGMAPQAAELPDFTDLVEENAPAVVNISTIRTRSSSARSGRPDLEELIPWFRQQPNPRRRGGDRPRPRSQGSGFIVSSDGLVLTNNHVVEDAEEIVVRLSDRRELTAEVVGTDPRSDLAVLRIEGDDFPTVKMGDSSQLKVGEWVLAIGSPFGFDYSVTAGIVSAKGRSLPTQFGENYVPYIQTDVAINPGNSGGPLFDLEGRVVGINSQIYSNSGGFMGVSFAIPIDVAMEVADQLQTDGRVARGWLGVEIQEVDRTLAEGFGLERPHGALINNVLDGSPAEQGGLQAGDIVTEFNGNKIERSSELPHYVGRARPDRQYPVRIVRDGEVQTLKIKIGELADRGEPQVANGNADTEIGLTVASLSQEEQQRLDTKGVRVTRSSGAAAEAGVRVGDIITKFNNVIVEEVADFEDAVEDLADDKERVPVLVKRGQQSRFLIIQMPESG